MIVNSDIVTRFRVLSLLTYRVDRVTESILFAVRVNRARARKRPRNGDLFVTNYRSVSGGPVSLTLHSHLFPNHVGLRMRGEGDLLS